MKENLSVDEIIKQAEEIRKKSVSAAQSAVENAESNAESVTRKIEVPPSQNSDGESDSTQNDIVKENKKTADSKNKPDAVDEEKTTVINKKSLDSSVEKNSDIQKTRQVTVDDKTGVVNNVKDIKKKKSFFASADSSEPQYSKDPPDIIEKSATIKSKSKFDKTLDLEEIPTIVAVEELENTKINLSQGKGYSDTKNTVAEEGDQIVLDGFEDSTDEISKIDEDLAEKQLKERRKDKVNKFRLFSPEDVEEARTRDNDNVVNDEYIADESDDLLSHLELSRASAKKTVIATVVLTAVIGILTGLKDSSFLPSFLLDSVPYFVTMLVLYAAVIAVNIKSFIRGFNLKHGINGDFPITVVSILVFVHTVLLIVDSDLLLDGGSAYTLAVSFAFMMNGAGKYTMLTRIISNFNFIVNQKERYCVETIVNQVDASIISRGLLTGETNLKTSIKTDFPSKFLDIASSGNPCDKIAKITGLIMLALSAVSFGVFCFVDNNWHIALNIAICSLCISLPAVSYYNVSTAVLGLSKQLNKSGAMINGYAGAAAVDDANAIVIEAQDLFAPRSCHIHGIKTFNGAKADDVILKTAAVIINTKSPLASVFDDVIIGKQNILPEVDGIVYEDKLGTSAWIYKKKVLVGTRELLIHHGVTVPKEEYEKKYTRKGRKILYLAVTGKVAAMFVVSYNADPQLKKSLKKLEKSGMTILVRSADPFINDESIAELFSLPDGYIRVMNASNGRSFEKYSDMYVEKSPAYVVHNGSALGFVSAMNAAENLQDTRRILSVLSFFGCALGFGVVNLLSAVNAYSELGALSVVAFQAVWCIFTEIVSRIKRLGL